MTTGQGIGKARKTSVSSSTEVPAISGHVTFVMPVCYAKDPTQPTHATSPKEEGYGRVRMAEGNTHTNSTERTLGKSWNSKRMI